MEKIHVVIELPSTNSLQLHVEDIKHDHKLQTSHILCLMGKKVHNSSINVYTYVNLTKYLYL